jgi:hypothetical protein
MGFPKASNKTKQEWKRKIEECGRSGKSMRAWCLENNIVYPTFLAWRTKFRKMPKPFNQENLNSFIEIPEANNPTNTIEIEWNGAKIRVTKDFDLCFLKQCLQLIRNL